MNTITSWQAQWIRPSREMGEVCPVYIRDFKGRKAEKAELYVTAMGVYEAYLNGTRVGDFILAPGWTTYEKRLQYQCYDVTELLGAENRLEITVGKGWYRGSMPGWSSMEERKLRGMKPAGLIAQLCILWKDGEKETIVTDGIWRAGESRIRQSEIYDGEVFDAGFETVDFGPVVCFEGPIETLIPQEGEVVREQEHIQPASIFRTPAGETVIDFGQNMTGYVRFTVDAKAGDVVRISHGEVMDKDGNFYNDNYRTAKASIEYICRDGVQVYQPRLTYYGFRYIRLEQFPGEPVPEQFTAIVVHSDMKRTGYLKCSDSMLNQLFSNVLWGQKGNFLDVPTDCPQRDERMGWTGDAQIFIKTAGYNYDVEKFFAKWLGDLAAEQYPNGALPHVVPAIEPSAGSAAWCDAVTICPWQLYLTYGNTEILRQMFGCMKKYISYITEATKDPYLWTGCTHFGDWLGLDAPSGSLRGASREDFIASAFYAYSTLLVIKTGKVLGEDVSSYEVLYENIVRTFRRTYPDYRTQTEHVLAIYFQLAEDPWKTADDLAEMITACGSRLQTGFVGTPYLLHVLSSYGHTELAYTLLLRREYPSWLYPITKGATTMWEHWDGIMENGDFWSDECNSYNHYVYGSVADWVYEVAAGIRPMEEAPGFQKVYVEPHPDERLEWLEASIETRHGLVRSQWKWVELNGIEKKVCYEISVPVPAVIVIDGIDKYVESGHYIFWGNESSIFCKKDEKC